MIIKKLFFNIFIFLLIFFLKSTSASTFFDDIEINDNFYKNGNGPILIYAKINKGNLIINDINLIQVSKEGNFIIELSKANDSGLDGDELANDGIYTASLKPSIFPSDGFYLQFTVTIDQIPKKIFSDIISLN